MKIKRIIYYIFLTIAFLILPMSIRNIKYNILISNNLWESLLNIFFNIIIFIYPFGIALIIRHRLKKGKWPLPKFIEIED